MTVLQMLSCHHFNDFIESEICIYLNSLLYALLYSAAVYWYEIKFQINNSITSLRHGILRCAKMCLFSYIYLATSQKMLCNFISNPAVISDGHANRNQCYPSYYTVLWHWRREGSTLLYTTKEIGFLLWSQIARFKGPTWGPPGADRTQVGPTNLAIRDVVVYFLHISQINTPQLIHYIMIGVCLM